MKATHEPGLRTILLLALAAILGASAPAQGANAPIYKCLDTKLGVVYTDLPCKDGEKLDLRPGDADPSAVARLERERDLLDQSAAQRIQDQRRAALQRDLAGMAMQAPYPREIAEPLAYGYDYGYPLAAYPLLAYPRHAHRDRPDARRSARSRGGAPSPPYIVPRR